jgi:hypothetical protein
MTAPAREPSPRLLVDTIEHLRKDNAALSRLVTEMKEREARLVRALSEMFQAPAQSVASAKYADGQWEVVMTTGAVWQRVRAKTEPYANEAELARYRESIGTDTDEYEVQS